MTCTNDVLCSIVNVDTFYLEYDTPRAGGFEPLKHLPKDKNVILGVLSSKFPKLEDQQEMVDRVYQAADTIATGNDETREEALQRVGVSCQCGFASHAEVSTRLLAYPSRLHWSLLVLESAANSTLSTTAV